ncbi:hypothetical protein ACR6C2_17915 [Streptomyces sp. INA 01156]
MAKALTAQDAPGVRALGLLRDARRILTGGFLQKPAEVAESCLRGAMDALLGQPDAPSSRVPCKIEFVRFAGVAWKQEECLCSGRE